MSTTVKKIVDEYVSRQNDPEFDGITFQYLEDKLLEQHSEICNLYRDGERVTELHRDTEFHDYQLDRRFDSWSPDKPPKWIRYNFNGKIIRFSKVIEE